MPRLRLCVEVPHGLSICTLRELLAMHGALVHGWELAPPAPAEESPRCPVSLTPSELAVLRAFAYCDSKEGVAARLGISPGTVKSHTESVYRKLRVRSRGCALGRALRLGLLTLQDLEPPPNGR